MGRMEVKTKHMILLNAHEIAQSSKIYMDARGNFNQKGYSCSDVSY